MPAKAGIHLFSDHPAGALAMDSGLRRNDGGPFMPIPP
jgi:hypothetical protein